MDIGLLIWYDWFGQSFGLDWYVGEVVVVEFGHDMLELDYLKFARRSCATRSILIRFIDATIKASEVR